MLSLRWVHVFVIAVSIMLVAGCGVWGLLNHHVLLGCIALGAGVLLIAYGAYFASKGEQVRLE